MLARCDRRMLHDRRWGWRWRRTSSWLLGAGLLLAASVVAAAAEAPPAGSPAAAPPDPAVYLWGVRRGCDFDDHIAREVVGHLQEIKPGRRIVVLRPPATAEARSCTGRLCIDTLRSQCAAKTAIILGGELDEVAEPPGAGGPRTRFRLWRYDLEPTQKQERVRYTDVLDAPSSAVIAQRFGELLEDAPTSATYSAEPTQPEECKPPLPAPPPPRASAARPLKTESCSDKPAPLRSPELESFDHLFVALYYQKLRGHRGYNFASACGGRVAAILTDYANEQAKNLSIPQEQGKSKDRLITNDQRKNYSELLTQEVISKLRVYSCERRRSTAGGYLAARTLTVWVDIDETGEPSELRLMWPKPLDPAEPASSCEQAAQRSPLEGSYYENVNQRFSLRGYCAGPGLHEPPSADPLLRFIEGARAAYRKSVLEQQPSRPAAPPCEPKSEPKSEPIAETPACREFPRATERCSSERLKLLEEPKRAASAPQGSSAAARAGLWTGLGLGAASTLTLAILNESVELERYNGLKLGRPFTPAVIVSGLLTAVLLPFAAYAEAKASQPGSSGAKAPPAPSSCPLR